MEFQLSFYIPFPLIFVHIPCDVVMIVGDVFKSPMAFRKVEIQRLSHLHFWCRKEDLEVGYTGDRMRVCTEIYFTNLIWMYMDSAPPSHNGNPNIIGLEIHINS